VEGNDNMNINELYLAHKTGGTDIKKLYKEYEALSSGQVSELIDMIICDNVDEETKIFAFLYLALYSYSCGKFLPNKMYNFLIENNIYYFGELYLRADESVAKKLIQRISQTNGAVDINHLMCAIAAIPCETTKTFLVDNSQKPLQSWTKQLHILPIEYAMAYGWTVDRNNQIVRLYSEKVTAFEPCDKEETSSAIPLKLIEEECGYCHQPMALVFDGEQKLATCLHCSCYELIYTKQIGSKVVWHEKNKPYDFFVKYPEYMKNDEDFIDIIGIGLKPSSEKRKATYAANQFAEISRTQIGGLPTSINDICYPKCIECGEIMEFTAQLDMEDVEDYGEGIYYFFTCKQCGVHAASYDQT
jgi:hypothetical protein